MDRIHDFSMTDDTIRLDRDIFAAVGTVGGLASSAFAIYGNAQDAFDRIIYDKAEGIMWYDADCTGAGAAIQFATIDKGLGLTADDFLIIA